jgi:hypothetical protein
MSSSTLGGIRSGLALCAACLLWTSLGGAPARAGGDDGAAPLWVGLGSIVGFGGSSNDEPIEYRDHGRLVLPPKADLPPPAAPAVQGAAGWPVDPDLERRKREKAEQDAYFFIPPSMRKTLVNDPKSKVTVSATAGQAPGQKPCVKGPGQTCATRPSPSMNWNPLTWVGLEKKPQTVLGPEPDRDWLTDPPKGYREPVEGEGARMDN